MQRRCEEPYLLLDELQLPYHSTERCSTSDSGYFRLAYHLLHLTIPQPIISLADWKNEFNISSSTE